MTLEDELKSIQAKNASLRGKKTIEEFSFDIGDQPTDPEKNVQQDSPSQEP